MSYSYLLIKAPDQFVNLFRPDLRLKPTFIVGLPIFFLVHNWFYWFFSPNRRSATLTLSGLFIQPKSGAASTVSGVCSPEPEAISAGNLRQQDLSGSQDQDLSDLDLSSPVPLSPPHNIDCDVAGSLSLSPPHTPP